MYYRNIEFTKRACPLFAINEDQTEKKLQINKSISFKQILQKKLAENL